jgi:hypothetical protein
MAGKTNKSQEGYYAKYKSSKTWETNRKARLERALKAQPNNEQIKAALKGMVYRRKTPGPLGWSAQDKAAAQLYRRIAGYFDRGILSKDPKVSQLALQRKLETPLPKAVVAKVPSYGPSFFALGARLQGT